MWWHRPLVSQGEIVDLGLDAVEIRQLRFASGGTAVVHKLATRDGTLLCAKDTNNPQDRARELQVFGILRHAVPNLVRCYGTAQLEIEPGNIRTLLLTDMVTSGGEPVEQGNFNVTFHRQLEAGWISPEDAWQLPMLLASRLLVTVGAMAARRVAVCDIKHENILYTESGELRLFDMGAWAAFGQLSGGYTPGYAAPELKEDMHRTAAERRLPQRVHETSDVFNVARMLEEMVTNVQALDSDVYDIERPRGILSADPQIVEDYVDLVARMKTFDPSGRFRADQALAHPFFHTFDEHRAAALATGVVREAAGLS